MTMNEGLLRRWSRRKQAAQAAPAPTPARAPAPAAPEPVIAEADLPPIASLGLASDYTAFLQKGVAAEVQRRALQRAWQSDERIAGFRGLAEYAWDFNAPQYGRLWASDDVLKLVQAVLDPPPAELVEESAVAAVEAPAAAPVPAAIAAAEAPSDLAAEAEPAPKDAGVRRHGSALPC